MYASLADLVLYLDISGIDDGALLTQCLTRAQAAIDAYCGRVFEANADGTRYFGAEAVQGARLRLDADLCTVTSVVNGDGAAVAAANYRTAPRNQTPWHALELRPTATLVWDAWTDDIAVTGKWAYSATAPADVGQACVRLAAWLYRQRENSSGDLDRALVVGNATVLPARLPSDITQLLAAYRRHI